MQTIEFPALGSLTLAQLSALPTSRLVELYNAKAPKAVTSTPTKSKFIPRVWTLYGGGQDESGTTTDTTAITPTTEESTSTDMSKKSDKKASKKAAVKAKAAKTEKPAKTPKEKPAKKERAKKDLNFPAAAADARKLANRGSRMESLLTLASRKNGVNEEELKKESKAKDRFRAMLAWASEGLGWGFKEFEPGRVRLVDGAGHAVEYTPRPESGTAAE